MIRIIPYEDQYERDFRELNRSWLESYGLLESHDMEIIEDPRGMILKDGGFIFLAESEGQIVGTVGLVKETSDVYELVKMGVLPASRGKGIGRLLIDKCILTAREAGAKKIYLFSNSQLQHAISLYREFGFVHVAPGNAPYVSADVKMELLI
jgi:GNAT superfamily N-acetyltransferase